MNISPCHARVVYTYCYRLRRVLQSGLTFTESAIRAFCVVGRWEVGLGRVYPDSSAFLVRIGLSRVAANVEYTYEQGSHFLLTCATTM